jgi:acyl dehydratase
LVAAEFFTDVLNLDNRIAHGVGSLGLAVAVAVAVAVGVIAIERL